MPLQINSGESEGVTIFNLKGRLVFGEEASNLQDAIQDALTGGNTKLIINLKEVPFVDSTGLGVLVVAHSAAQKANGAIVLLYLSRRHMELLILTKLNALFAIFDDERAAIDSFFPERAIPHFDILEFVKSQENDEGRSDHDSEKPDSGS